MYLSGGAAQPEADHSGPEEVVSDEGGFRHQFCSNLLTVSEICSRDMVKVEVEVEGWKKEEAHKGEGGGPKGEEDGRSRGDGRRRQKKRVRRSHVSGSSGGKEGPPAAAD